MTLRTTALIAGALGLLLLIGGLIADAMRPAAFGTPSAAVDTPVLIIGPEMVAMAPGGTLTIEGDGEIVAYAGRTADAEEWAASRDATRLTGVPTWDDLSTEAVEATASPEPTASATPASSADASGEPTADASPAAAASATPSASATPDAAASSTPEIADIWRDSWEGDGTLTLEADSLPVGLTIVAESADGAPLTGVAMKIDRVVNDGWVTPLKWWGGVLAVVGLIALVSLLVDHRGAGSKVETAVAGRKPAAPASPGGRRERREAMTASGGIPIVDGEIDPATGELPVQGDDAPAGPTDEREERA
ncbi:hypothetical protein [Demequina silvatica]|uniref:hypothetical protein n=1 Tax=Demequina silvatica TaxID=1638988 RepID=UPI000A4CEEBD|nr:hypothetical protein [Demequina silvatica]